MLQVPRIDFFHRVDRGLPATMGFDSRDVLARPGTCGGYSAILVLVLLFLSSHCLATDNPGASLTKQFEAAKAALSAQELAKAEQHYRETIALGLRQLGNLSLSENRFDQATQYLDDA